MNKSSPVWLFFLAALLVASLGLYAYSTACGLAPTQDSWYYISAAKTFKETGVMRNPDGTAYFHWPPLYPFMLQLVNFEKTNNAAWLQTVAVLASVLLMVRLAFAVLADKGLILLYAGSLFFAAPLLLLANFLWSEALFLFLLTLHFYLLWTYARKKQHWLLLSLILTDNLLCLQRNAGLIFILATLIFLLVLPGKKKEVLISSATYGALAVMAFVYWNFKLGPGAEHVSLFVKFQELAYKASSYLIVVGSWVVPQPYYLAGFMLLIAATIAFIYAFKRDIAHLLQKPLVLLLTIHVLFYFAVSITFPTPEHADMERYLAIIYPAAFLLIFICLQTAFARLSPKVYKTALVMIAVWLLYPAGRSVKNAIHWHNLKCSPKTTATSEHPWYQLFSQA